MYKNIMFQGTGSTVGKSILVAAMCRILNDDGYQVAPFKSQNMALNSFITEDGYEMGRAQAVQAEAARLKPSVDMNPILLKPTSHVGSQIILNGKVYKNMKAKEYFANKTSLIPHIEKAYSKLDSNFDAIVLEGAGSPAEINLMKDDIVNMGMAKLVDSPVVIVGDVDKGGVFASIYGTYMLVDDESRNLIKGFVINKFRGDVDILMPGIKMLEEKINVPCLGVIPFIEEMKIDDEDSVTDRFKSKLSADVKVGVIRLPYMSNFTDFTALEAEEDVSVHYITSSEEISEMDMLIIPGSKNTIHDMSYIVNQGLTEGIYRFRKSNKPVVGICGGYQILGNSISDPDAVESKEESINGLALLDIVTEMATEKTTVQTEGFYLKDFYNCSLKEKVVKGYEIHMGVSEVKSGEAFIKLEDGRMDGCISEDGLVMGTYLHGIFDNDDFRGGLINQIRESKGLSSNKRMSYAELKEQEYDRVAKIVKDHIEYDKIKALMHL